MEGGNKERDLPFCFFVCFPFCSVVVFKRGLLCLNMLCMQTL